MEITVRLHHVPVRFTSPDASVTRHIAQIFQPSITDRQSVGLEVTIHRVLESPPSPEGTPILEEAGRLACFLDGGRLVAHFGPWGQLHIDLEHGRYTAYLTPPALDDPNILEDMLRIGLAPLLRRRGLFTIHAFAAARHGQAVLLVGGMGAGKTTTGISLLRAGWSLLSNDSPLLCGEGDRLTLIAYPGLLSAHGDSLAWFPELAAVLHAPPRGHGHAARKRTFSAEQVYPHVWTASARPTAVCFPEVVPGLLASHLEPVSAAQALVTLIPQSIEDWDRPLIGQHLDLLGRLVEAAPAYRLCLAPDVARLPGLLARLTDLPTRDR